MTTSVSRTLLVRARPCRAAHTGAGGLQVASKQLWQAMSGNGFAKTTWNSIKAQGKRDADKERGVAPSAVSRSTMRPIAKE
jgi:hypothetical protein